MRQFLPLPSLAIPKPALPQRVPRALTITGIAAGSIIVVLIFAGASFAYYFHNRIYPHVTVGQVAVGGLTADQAQAKLSQQYGQYLTAPITFASADRTWKVDPATVGLHIDATKSAQMAVAVGHQHDLWSDVKVFSKTIIKGSSVLPQYQYDQQAFTAQLSNMTQSLEVTPQSSVISYVDGQFIVGPSITGVTVDIDKLRVELQQHLSVFSSDAITIPTKTVTPAVTAERAGQLVPILTQYVTDPLELTYNDKKFTLDVQTILDMIDYDHPSANGLTLNQDKVNAFIDSFADQINQPAKNALFQFQDGKATAFQASQDGLEVDKAAVANLLTTTLLSGSTSRVLPIPVKVTPATVTTASVNDLGINELIGHGESNYKGSPADRIFNLTLATKRLNGTLVAPGQEFSFNQTVGEISQATGYEQGLVILSGRTVLGDGGGVCQVSTTLFRSVLNAGLPVTARTAHAYRVSYYENDMGPGYDATIYQPGVDFKFKNDTGHYILIQASTDPAVTKINIDIYGTSDGRVATLSKPVILSTTPAPPDVHQQDPTMPAGTSKQVEHSIPGAKVVFYRKVVRNGETLINESFTSNYVPWAAVFIDGTSPATSPAPQGT